MPTETRYGATFPLAFPNLDPAKPELPADARRLLEGGQERKRNVGVGHNQEFTKGVVYDGLVPASWTEWVNFSDPSKPFIQGTGAIVGGSLLIEAGDGTDLLFANATDVRLQSDSELAGVNVVGTLPAGWTRYVNLNGTGLFLKHDRFEAAYDGSVTMFRSNINQPVFKLTNTDFFLQNDVAVPTQGVLIDGTLPAGWTRYLNLNGSGIFLKHDKLELKYDGTAAFSGTVSATSFTGATAQFYNEIQVGNAGVFSTPMAIFRTAVQFGYTSGEGDMRPIIDTAGGAAPSTPSFIALKFDTTPGFEVNMTPGGVVTVTSYGKLILAAAVSQVIPGTTSLAFRNNADSANNLLIVDAGDVTVRRTLTIGDAGGYLLRSSVVYTDNAGVASGTLTNAPAAGNPTKWLAVDDFGTLRYIPAW